MIQAPTEAGNVIESLIGQTPGIAAVIITVVVMLSFGWRVYSRFVETLDGIGETSRELSKRREDALMEFMERLETRAQADRTRLYEALSENTKMLGVLESTLSRVGRG